MMDHGSCDLFMFSLLYLTVFIVTSFVDHPWIQNAKKALNVPLGDIVRSRLKQFSMMNRLKKKALRVSVPLILLSLYFCLVSSLNTYSM